MRIFTFLGFVLKFLFWGLFGPKVQNFLFKVKLDAKTNSKISFSGGVHWICF